MKSYVSLERAKSVDKDALIDSAFKKFNKQNVDKNGDYIKYSDLEQNFDGVTQMYEGLNELEDALIDYIEVIQTVKGIVKDKLKDGNSKLMIRLKTSCSMKFKIYKLMQTNGCLIILVMLLVVSTNLLEILTKKIFINYKKG